MDHQGIGSGVGVSIIGVSVVDIQLADVDELERRIGGRILKVSEEREEGTG